MSLKFTTSHGTVIPKHILETALEEISEGMDALYVLNCTLREAIPVHEDDLDEAYEVLSYLEDEANFISL